VIVGEPQAQESGEMLDPAKEAFMHITPDQHCL